MPTPETSIGRYWSKRVDHARTFYAPWNDRYGRMLAFALDMKHYKNERGDTTDRRLVQPKGQALFGLIRHKAAVISGAPIAFKCRPVQPVSDSGRAELSQRLLERVIFDPLLRYKQARHRFVLSALAGGRGVMAIEHLVDDSPNGHIAVRVTDPRRFHPAPGFVDIHDRRTPWVVEEVPVTVDWLMQQRENGWDIPGNLAFGIGSDDPAFSGVTQDTDFDLRRDNDGDRPGADEWDNQKVVTLIRCYSRRDPWKKTRSVKRREYELPRNEWYFADNFGNKIPAEVDLDDPKFQPPVSPADMTPMRLVTREAEMAEELAYHEGRLSICIKGSDKPVFDDTWTPRTRTFPYMFMNCYLHPLRLIGKSDTEANHSLQVIDNAALKNAYDQTRLAQAILVMRKNGLMDTEGRPFRPSDEPLQIAVAGGALDAEAIKFFQAPGMNSTLPQFYQMIQSQWANIGTGDIKMPDNRSRDIPVGTMQALQSVGELPSRVHIEMLQGEEAIGFGTMLDILRDTMTVQDMLSWVTDMGEVQFTEVTGKDMNPVNVVVDAQQDISLMDSDRVQAIAQFMGQVPPPMWGALAKTAGFPPDAIRDLTAFSQQLQAQQQQGVPAPGAPTPADPAQTPVTPN